MTSSAACSSAARVSAIVAYACCAAAPSEPSGALPRSTEPSPKPPLSPASSTTTITPSLPPSPAAPEKGWLPRGASGAARDRLASPSRSVGGG